MSKMNLVRRTASVVAYGWENDEGFHFSMQVKDLERASKRTLGSYLVSTKDAAEHMIVQQLADQGYDAMASRIDWR